MLPVVISILASQTFFGANPNTVITTDDTSACIKYQTTIINHINPTYITELDIGLKDKFH